jgi:hypothetical protein
VQLVQVVRSGRTYPLLFKLTFSSKDTFGVFVQVKAESDLGKHRAIQGIAKKMGNVGSNNIHYCNIDMDGFWGLVLLDVW